MALPSRPAGALTMRREATATWFVSQSWTARLKSEDMRPVRRAH